MTSEQSKPIALDERDVHLFFCMFGRYEPAMALGIIVMLSVWALFLILHRTARGQRRKKDENAVATEASEVEKMAIKEENLCHIKSTASENLREELSEAQDNSIGECGGPVSLPRDPGLCDGAPDELSWPITGEYQSTNVPESRGHETVCWDIPQEHVGKLTKHICAPSVLADQNSHFDNDVDTQEKVEFLYANLNSQSDPDLEKSKLSALEETIKNGHDSFDENHQQVSRHKDDSSSGAGDSPMFQKNTLHGLDGNRNSQLEEAHRIPEIYVMETAILNGNQHLRKQCEHLSDFHYHGLLSCPSDRQQPLRDPSQVNAIGEVAESKPKSLNCNRKQPPEDNCERTEINIMEATMDYNEWMNGGGAETNKLIGSSGKGPNGTADLGDAGTAERCHQESADSNLAKISITKEPGATLASFARDPATKRAAAVQPTPQTVAVSFCVHYITHAPLQLLAVAGNQKELGNWETFLPLMRAKDGFWANSVTLPAHSHVEWKFVVVENGRIQRWEECKNRHLQTGYEEVIHLQKWWGCV